MIVDHIHFFLTQMLIILTIKKILIISSNLKLFESFHPSLTSFSADCEIISGGSRRRFRLFATSFLAGWAFVFGRVWPWQSRHCSRHLDFTWSISSATIHACVQLILIFVCYYSYSVLRRYAFSVIMTWFCYEYSRWQNQTYCFYTFLVNSRYIFHCPYCVWLVV